MGLRLGVVEGTKPRGGELIRDGTHRWIGHDRHLPATSKHELRSKQDRKTLYMTNPLRGTSPRTSVS